MGSPFGRNRPGSASLPTNTYAAQTAAAQTSRRFLSPIKKDSFIQPPFHTVAHTQLRVAGVGSCGPDLLIGKATTRGFHQSVLSKQLNPPVKWSYRKLTLWWVVVFLSIGWIVFYINTIPKNSAAVLSPPLVLWSGLSAVTFLLLLVFFWRHNQSTHKRRYSQWERSLLCQRCGTLTEQEF